jgi:hypothetical protein
MYHSRVQGWAWVPLPGLGAPAWSTLLVLVVLCLQQSWRGLRRVLTTTPSTRSSGGWVPQPEQVLHLRCGVYDAAGCGTQAAGSAMSGAAYVMRARPVHPGRWHCHTCLMHGIVSHNPPG